MLKTTLSLGNGQKIVVLNLANMTDTPFIQKLIHYVM